MFSRMQPFVDSYIINSETREHYWNKTGTFAQEQPLLFTFILAQLLFSFLPLALVSSFVLGAALLSLTGALIFFLFWAGLSLLLLVPTLFVTVSLGFILWVWAIVSFLIAKWVYDMMPVSERGTKEVRLQNGNKLVVKKGEGNADLKGEVRDGA